MLLIEKSLKHPHAVVVVVILCAIFGYLALTNLPVQMKPTVDRPEITIQTYYRGASPSEVEDQITTPIENEMDAVEGINKITSSSIDGFSSVTLEFDWGVDKDIGIIDVVNKLSQVSDLPDDADEPQVRAVSEDQEEPVMWIVMTGDKTPNEMFEIAEDTIEPRFRRVEGVGDLFVFGGEEREYQIQVDPVALAGRGISYAQLAAAITNDNKNVRGGFLDQGKRRYTVRTVGRFTTPEEVLSTIIAYDQDGGPVYLREVAAVERGYKKKLSDVRHNNNPTVVFGVIRKTGANVVELCHLVEDEVIRINEDFAQKKLGLAMKVVYTDVEYIEEAIDLVINNLLIGALLASMVLLLFLRSFRSGFVVILTIPICLITVFILLQFMGRSLNIISLAGLAFSVGMVLDNAIVVLENIFRHRAMDKDIMKACYDGASEVWGAIIVSTLTTLAVFIPIIFIQEEAGQLFKDIAIAISCAIGLSLLVSITVVPVASSILYRFPSLRERFEKLHPKLAKPINFFEMVWLGNFFAKIYNGTMSLLIGHGWGKVFAKLLVIVILLGIFVVSMGLLPEAEYLPSGNRNFILIFAKPLVGTNLDKQVESLAPFAVQLDAMKEEGRIDQYFSVLSNRFNGIGMIVSKEHSSEQEMQAFQGELFGRVSGITGFEGLYPIQPSIFRDPGKQFDVEISGPDLGRLQQITKQIEGRLYGLEGVVQFARSNYQEGSPEINVRLNRDKCARLGFRVSDVADAVESLIAGKFVGSYYEQGDELDLTIRSDDRFIQTKEDLAALSLVSPTGQVVKLSEITDVLTASGPTAINHLEKERAITLEVTLVPTVSLENAIERTENEILAPIRATLPGSYSLNLGGSADKLGTTLKALTGSFALAVIIVYLLMVALFESFAYPLIILATIPPAATGAFLGIKLSNTVSKGLVGFDVLSMLGLVILAGVVVNTAILIVHQALNFRKQGYDPDEALKMSCKTRLRPIIMSASTSALGMIPLTIGGGAGSELYRGLGAVVVGGIIVSTVFTLFLVPCLMSLVQDLQYAFGILDKKPASKPEQLGAD